MMNHLPFRTTADGPASTRVLPWVFLLICLVSATGTRLYAQATPTASADGELQIGATFVYGNSDYRPQNFKGYGAYATFDFRYHYGIEGEFHQLNDPDSVDGVYERTYEIGPRYVLHRGRYHPYAKLMYGRGVFNYPPVFGDPKIGPAANLAYNLGAIGAGVDYRVLPGLNARADYEYQRWLSFPPNDCLPGSSVLVQPTASTKSSLGRTSSIGVASAPLCRELV